MAHILVRLQGIKFDDIELVLLSDAVEHAERGMNLEHLWKNVDNEAEVLILFHANDLNSARAYINEMHTQAVSAFPDFPKPEMVFLIE